MFFDRPQPVRELSTVTVEGAPIVSIGHLTPQANLACMADHADRPVLARYLVATWRFVAYGDTRAVYFLCCKHRQGLLLHSAPRQAYETLRPQGGGSADDLGTDEDCLMPGSLGVHSDSYYDEGSCIWCGADGPLLRAQVLEKENVNAGNR